MGTEQIVASKKRVSLFIVARKLAAYRLLPEVQGYE